jgi:ribonuclease-3 family protein
MSDNVIPNNSQIYRQLSPITLAFMGDAVYEQLVREYIVRNMSNLLPAKLHKKSVELVNASAQAEAVSRIASSLTIEEHDILRRGRNAHSSHIPKNANPLDYRHATGLEALFGYLFLCEEHDRIKQIFELIINNQRQIG